MKSTRTLVLSAALAALAAPSASALNFEVTAASCDGDPFTDLAFDATCPDGDAAPNCSFDDTVSIDGTVKAIGAFSDANMILKSCVMNYYCPSKNDQAAGMLSDWLTPLDGQEFGQAGTYQVTGSGQIPPADIPNSWSGLVTVRIGPEDECEVETTSSYQMVSFSFVGLASLAVAGAACAAKRRQHRADGDIDERTTNFVEMRDHAVV
ncbi:hypothetical protein ACHAXT_011397 [Thalassiosira profunda]